MKVAVLCLASLVGAFLQPAARAADTEQCELKRVAELPVTIDEGRLLIQVEIEGRKASVLVDTGSPFSMISGQLADELQLHKSPIASGRAYDAAGKSLQHFVKIKKLTLNGMSAEDQTFVVMGENGSAPRSFDGVFGANFLAAYDIELDIPHGKMGLFLPNHCKQIPIYWTQNFAAVPFVLDASLHMVMTANLDGKSVRAMIDTGAGPTIIGAQTARQAFDVDPAASGQEPDGQEHTGSGASLAYYKHRFGVLDIGGVQFRNTELFILPDKMSRITRDHQSYGLRPESETNEATPLIIGIHHLARLRAYIAYRDRMIYISAGDAQ